MTGPHARDWRMGSIGIGTAYWRVPPSPLCWVSALNWRCRKTSTRATALIAGRESVQDTTNEIGQEITRRNLNIQPTLTVRPGFPMRVMVNKDLILRPYQPLFFQRGTFQ